MEWTNEQKKVIATRNKNVLVSAAAGSGKTAVLVERIIRMITDKENPVSISNLLVVTFTNAAAAQMKERIIKAIEKKLIEEPDNEHLKKQLVLTNTAMITTIDSFFNYVFKNYFNEINVSPALKVTDEAELKMLKNEAIEAVLDRYFEEHGDRFKNLVNMYSSVKKYDDFVEVVDKIYKTAVSQPYPEKWLCNLKKLYSGNEWQDEVYNCVMKEAIDAKNLLGELKEFLRQDGNLYSIYESNLTEDEEIIDSIIRCKSIEKMEKVMNNYKFPRIKNNKISSNEEKELIKAVRNEYKGYIDKAKKRYFSDSLKRQQDILDKLYPYMDLLGNFICDFHNEYHELKIRKKTMDFPDLSHYVLDILVDEKTKMPTSVAKQLADYYYEIMIDEYQDSNNVQELILTSISKKYKGINNIFMVGDVKQSIYRFRMACPEIFIDKYNTYEVEGKECERINLHTNFRSREHILEFVNKVFDKVMHSNIGGVEYDRSASLRYGADYEKAVNTFTMNEIILYDKGDVLEEFDSDIACEARIVASKINEIISQRKLVRDKENGLRPVEYGDIVVLSRKQKGINEAFIDAFDESGIPYEVNSTVGYFSSVEIKMILNILRIINNPYQDVAMVGTMLSPMFGFTQEELAVMRKDRKDVCFYDVLMMMEKQNEEEQHGFDAKTMEKCKNLREFVEKYRDIAMHTTTEELISCIISDIGMLDYVYAMSNAQKRRQNIEALINKAASLDYSGLSGLFKFIMTVEKMEKYQLDFEPPANVGAENSVKIMTIHKSKGLEFPVVFLVGTCLSYNQGELKSRLALDTDLGIGSVYVDFENRIKYDSAVSRLVKEKILRDSVGEELRILYVALTRAKEMLYIVGGRDRMVDVIKGYCMRNSISKSFGYNDIITCNSYLETILKALSSEDVYKQFIKTAEEDVYNKIDTITVEDREKHIAFTLIKRGSEYLMADAAIVEHKLAMEDIKGFDMNKSYCEKTYNTLKTMDKFSYRYQRELACKSKVSVSELKKAHMLESEEETDVEKSFVFETDIRKSYIPKFAREGEDVTITGAQRGTIYHMVMKELDFLGDLSYDGIRNQLERMNENGFIPDNYEEIIAINKIMRFLDTKEGKDMVLAAKNGKLYKEKQFVMGLPLEEVYGIESQEIAIIQGIIDVYYELEGKIYLLDYKTDAVNEEDGEKVLTDRYKLQLDYYKRAIEGGTSLPVVKSLIYSFSLGKTFEV